MCTHSITCSFVCHVLCLLYALCSAAAFHGSSCMFVSTCELFNVLAILHKIFIILLTLLILHAYTLAPCENRELQTSFENHVMAFLICFFAKR